MSMAEAILRFAMEALAECTEKQRTIYLLHRGINEDGTTRERLNVSEIARYLEIARPTAYAYLKQAEAAVNQRIALGVLGLVEPIATSDEIALIMAEDPAGAVTDEQRLDAHATGTGNSGRPIHKQRWFGFERSLGRIERDTQDYDPRTEGERLEAFHQKHLKGTE